MSKDVFQDLIIRGGLVGDKNYLRLFKNTRFTMYPARAFALFIQELCKDKGPGYVKELGRIMGDKSAKSMKEEISRLKGLISKDYLTVPHMIEISGFGKIESYEENGKQFIIRLKEHPVITPAKKLYGKESCSCNFYGEVFSEYIKSFKKIKKLVVSHPKCLCKGDDKCEWGFR